MVWKVSVMDYNGDETQLRFSKAWLYTIGRRQLPSPMQIYGIA